MMRIAYVKNRRNSDKEFGESSAKEGDFKSFS